MPFLNIKVLLNAVPRTERQIITIKSSNGLMLAGSSCPTKKYFFKDQLVLTIKDINFYINSQKKSDKIFRITPLDGTITLNNITYAGSIYIYINDKNIEIINKLPLEDYIDSVLRTEGWPGWPLETYKIFAITCRSYVIYQVQHTRKQKKHFHIGSTNAHQTYRGMHTCQTIKDAVNETTGVVISYKKQPILAMFDSCCGGITPAHTTGIVNLKEAPYLARPYPCTYCKGLKIYSWKKNVSLNSFKQTLQELYPKIGKIQNIETIHDKAGIVQNLRVKDTKKTYTVNGKKLYSLFPDINSFAFTVTKKRNNVLIAGTGYGHHIGLCQWGANELVKKKWNYKKVLNFYYPGTTLLRLKKKNSE